MVLVLLPASKLLIVLTNQAIVLFVPLTYASVQMGTFEIELPAGMEDDITEYIEEHGDYTSKSELIRDAVRHLLHSESSPYQDASIHINQQQIDRVDTDSLEDVKSEQE